MKLIYEKRFVYVCLLVTLICLLLSTMVMLNHHPMIDSDIKVYAEHGVIEINETALNKVIDINYDEYLKANTKNISVVNNI